MNNEANSLNLLHSTRLNGGQSAKQGNDEEEVVIVERTFPRKGRKVSASTPVASFGRDEVGGKMFAR